MLHIYQNYGTLGPMRIEWRCGRVKSPSLEKADNLDVEMVHPHKERSDVTLLRELQALMEMLSLV